MHFVQHCQGAMHQGASSSECSAVYFLQNGSVGRDANSGARTAGAGMRSDRIGDHSNGANHKNYNTPCFAVCLCQFDTLADYTCYDQRDMINALRFDWWGSICWQASAALRT